MFLLLLLLLLQLLLLLLLLLLLWLLLPLLLALLRMLLLTGRLYSPAGVNCMEQPMLRGSTSRQGNRGRGAKITGTEGGTVPLPCPVTQTYPALSPIVPTGKLYGV